MARGVAWVLEAWVLEAWVLREVAGQCATEPECLGWTLLPNWSLLIVMPLPSTVPERSRLALLQAALQVLGRE